MTDISQLAQLPSGSTPTPAPASIGTISSASPETISIATPGIFFSTATGSGHPSVSGTIADILAPGAMSLAEEKLHAAAAAAGGPTTSTSNAWAQADADILKYLAGAQAGTVLPPTNFPSVSTVDTSHALLSSSQSAGSGYDLRSLLSRLG